MHYCLKCPGPLDGHYGGKCPYCGSTRIVEADYDSESGKWYPIELHIGRFGREEYRWVKGDWARLEAEREQRELENSNNYLPYSEDCDEDDDYDSFEDCDDYDLDFDDCDDEDDWEDDY